MGVVAGRDGTLRLPGRTALGAGGEAFGRYPWETGGYAFSR